MRTLEVDICHVAAGRAPEAGIVETDKVQGLGVDMLSVIAAGRVPEARGPSFDLAAVKLLAPMPRPPKLICVGLNYRDHAAEIEVGDPQRPHHLQQVFERGDRPGRSDRAAESIAQAGLRGGIRVRDRRGGRHIPAAQAMDHVFGYTIVNDVSARDFQTATTQWLMGKTFDTFAPMGPWIVTEDEIADPHALDISLEIGGETSAELEHARNDLPHSGADRVSFDRGDARAGRRGLNGHAGGRRIRAQTAALAESRRRSDHSDLGHRRVAQSGGRRSVMRDYFPGAAVTRIPASL